MQLAIIGLGRMGKNMAQRLIKDGHKIIGYDQSAPACAELISYGAQTVSSLAQLKQLLKPPRIAWIMVPHGKAVDGVISELSQAFSVGDIIIDGANSHFIDSVSRHQDLEKIGITFIDIGVSGGVFGLERGYCLMAGGDQKAVDYIEPILASLSPGEGASPPTANRHKHDSCAHRGFYYCGKSGSGHYVKMVHNAIEYGLMQSYAEGFELLKNADYDFDLKEISELWRRGSVVGSWLLDLLAHALHKDPSLSSFTGHVPDSGEGRWALMEAIKQNTPTPNLANALFTRFRSRQESSLAEKSLSALRAEFGGHAEASNKA